MTIKVNFNFIEGNNLLVELNFESYDEFMKGFINGQTNWCHVNSSHAGAFSINMFHVAYMQEVFI